MASFSKMCEPAKLYLVVSMIFLVMAIFNRISALTLVIKGVFVLIWTMVLNWLCSKGFSGLAWIIVLLPFLVLFMAMFTTMDMMGHGGGYEGFGPSHDLLHKKSNKDGGQDEINARKSKSGYGCQGKSCPGR
jgi:energy-coupling factor transporter transmembrane protein EcfT